MPAPARPARRPSSLSAPPADPPLCDPPPPSARTSCCRSCPSPTASWSRSATDAPAARAPAASTESPQPPHPCTTESSPAPPPDKAGCSGSASRQNASTHAGPHILCLRELPRIHGRGSDVPYLSRLHHIVQRLQRLLDRRLVIPPMNLIQIHKIH